MSLIKQSQKTLSHKEALQEVYKLTPQIRDYDAFMHVGARWLPYTMYFHDRNFISDTINTDDYGFRYSHLNHHRYSLCELQDTDKPLNLLVGGSTALGVGATCDEKTLASYLSEHTGELWLNFAGRGYNATQELLMFIMHQKKLKNLNNVVVLSGINSLALEGIPDQFACEHGRYYYSFEFQHYMNKYNEDIRKKKDSFMEKDASSPFLQKIKSLLVPENPADIVIDDSEVDLNTRILRAANVITDALQQWKLLLSSSTAKLHFFLQPLAYWAKEKLTDDEQAVFHAIDHCPNNFYRLFSNVLGKDVHPVFYNAIKSALDNYNISGYDMNKLLTRSNMIDNTLFVDRVHFNDLGNNVLSQLIHQTIYQN